MLPAHLRPVRRAARIAAVALSSTLAGCAEEPPPRAPAAVAGPAPEVRAAAWLAHLGPEDPQYQDTVLAIAASGDAATQRAASQRLVAQARALTSPAWRETGRARLRQVNAEAKVEPTPAQLEAQLDLYRDEQLARLLAGMERAGSPEAVAYAFEVAEDDAVPTKSRQAAMAVLAKLVDKLDTVTRARASAVWERLAARAAAEASDKPDGGSVGNASRVVAGMAGGFRRCYNKGLQEDPNMKGLVRITAKIGPRGEVLSVSPSGSGLSAKVISCVADRVAEAVFSPPEGGGATIVIPVTFVSKSESPTPPRAPSPASP